MSKAINKFMLVAVVSICMMIVLAACSDNKDTGNTGNNTKAAEEQSLKLIFAMDQSPTDSWVLSAEKFADIVKEKTDGRIAISVHNSGTLGGQRQALEGIKAGT